MAIDKCVSPWTNETSFVERNPNRLGGLCIASLGSMMFVFNVSKSTWDSEAYALGAGFNPYKAFPVKDKFLLGAQGQCCHNLTPFVLEEEAERHFQQTSLVVMVAEHAVVTNVQPKMDNGCLEGWESIVRAP
ncbi:hypothetical protein Tco_1317177 [Tanacetum coccineum]